MGFMKGIRRAVSVLVVTLVAVSLGSGHVQGLVTTTTAAPKVLSIVSTQRGQFFDLKIAVQHGRRGSAASLISTSVSTQKSRCRVSVQKSSCVLKGVKSGSRIKVSVVSKFKVGTPLSGKSVSYRVGTTDWPTPTSTPTTTLPASFARRTYSVHIPSQSGVRQMPLVVLLHGYGSTGARQEAYMKVASLADKEKFVLVVPDGTENSRRERFWNAGPICCDFFNSRVNDEQFLVDLVKYVSMKNNVDSRRVYFIGHSNGGAMAYRMACHHRDLVVAMASLAGVGQDEISACGGSASVGVLHIHGTSDEEVNYLGGLRFGKPYVSALELSSRWAELNQCEARNRKLPQKIDLVRNLPGDETEISVWTSCSQAVKNELWTIDRGNHVPALSEDFIAKVYAFLSSHSR